MGTTAEKGAYTLQTKSLLKQKINNLGGNIDSETTFREYVDELQDVYDNYPKTEYQEGTSITLENCNKGKLDFDNGVVGIGQSSQESTQGYNLYYMNYQDDSRTWNNLNITSTKIGYSVKGTSNNSSGYTLVTRYVTLPAGTYRLGLKKATTLPYVGLSTTSYSSIINIAKTNKLSNAFTLNAETNVCLTLSVTNGETYNEENEVMIYSGTDTKDYEPYTGGYASPSPNWEQQVKCVAGKNKYNGVEYEGKMVNTSTGALENNPAWNTGYLMPVNARAIYSYSSATQLGAEWFGINEYDGSKNWIRSRHVGVSGTYGGQITLGDTTHYVRLGYRSDKISSPNTIQFEEGNQITPYLPYNTIEEVVRGKNLFDFAKLKNGNPTMNYPERASITFGEDSFRIDVTTVGDNFTNSGMTVTNQTVQSYQRKFLYEVKPNTKYTFIFETEHSEPVSLSSYYSLANKDFVVTNYDNTYVNFITIDSTHRRFYRTFTTKSDTKYVGFRYGDQGSVSVTYSKIMLVEGEYTSSNLPDYEPYHTPASYQLSLGDKELYDECTIVGSPDNWKFVDNWYKLNLKNIGPYWSKDTTTENWCSFYTDSYSNKFVANENSKCNRLIYESNQVTILNNAEPRFSVNSSQFIRVKINGTITTAQQLYEYFTNNETYIVGKLATPIETPITDTTLISQLNAWYNSQSNNGTTIIESNGDLPMIIKVRALKGES